MQNRFLQIVLALWAGSLCTICGIVAPSLFSISSDRHLAGELAGHFFRVESWLGLGLGGIALALLAKGPVRLRNTTNYALVTVTVAGPVSNEVVLRSFMESARVAGDTKMFGLMHGAGALLFGFACVTSLILIWRAAAPDQR